MSVFYLQQQIRSFLNTMLLTTLWRN